MKKLAVTFIAFMSFAFSANAGSYYLHYTLKSGSSVVQGGYSSYNQCKYAAVQKKENAAQHFLHLIVF